MMVTKKGVTIVMTVGLVPLLMCFIGLFPYGFNIVYQVDYDHADGTGYVLPLCLTIVTYLLLLVCFYLDLFLKSYKNLIILALHVVGSLFNLAVGASLSYATDNTVMTQVMAFGISGLMLCGVVGLSLWPLTYYIKDVSLGMKRSYRLIAVYVMIAMSVVIYLIYIVGVITFTVGMIKKLNHHDPSEYDDSGVRSFYLVPLYVIVAAFPALVASKFIYNHWEKKAALVGYLITPISCLLLVTIGYCLVNTSFLLKIYFSEIIKEQPLYAGRVIVLLGLSAMSLFVLFILLLWSYLLSKYPNKTEDNSINRRLGQENRTKGESDNLLDP